MRRPLSDFAARIVRNNELAEFIRGLIDEYGVSKEAIMQAAMNPREEENLDGVCRIQPKFRRPVDGVDGTTLYDLRDCGDKG